jgi:hypothetical protein
MKGEREASVPGEEGLKCGSTCRLDSWAGQDSNLRHEG